MDTKQPAEPAGVLESFIWLKDSSQINEPDFVYLQFSSNIILLSL